MPPFFPPGGGACRRGRVGVDCGRTPPSPPAAFPVPIENRWVWPFELLEMVGRGGMGEVYKARFVKNDRVVAVKLLPDEVTDDTVLARFERELGLLRDMRHPHIVHTFGGTTEGGAGGTAKRFYAMEYLSGGTLQDVLDRDGRVSPAAVVRYAGQICDALAFAHGAGGDPPGPQARELPADRRGHAETGGLRPRRRPRGQQADRGGPHDGDVPLHGPRADPRQAARLPADGPLRPGRGPLRTAHRPAAVPGGDAGGDAAIAPQGGGPAGGGPRAALPAGVGPAGGGPDGEADRGPPARRGRRARPAQSGRRGRRGRGN